MAQIGASAPLPAKPNLPLPPKALAVRHHGQWMGQLPQATDFSFSGEAPMLETEVKAIPASKSREGVASL